MTRPRRILFVTEKFPYPIDDGGQIRTYHLLRTLAADFPVTLLSLDPPSTADAMPIRELGVEVVCCGPRRSRWTAPAFALQALFTRAPYPMRKNFSRRIVAEMRKRIASGAVAAVHFNHLDAAQYVKNLGPERTMVRTVFDTHNLLTTMYERFAHTAANPLRKGYATVQWWKMSHFEPVILRAVDRVLVCSDFERDLVNTWGIDHAMVVPNGVDVAMFSGIERNPRKCGATPMILFTGTLSYAPNAEGVRWFLERVMPEIAGVLPRFRVVIVGKGVPMDLLAHSRPGEVEFTGWVEDVRPWLAQADVAVVPIRVGGGTRIKILEAMAAGVPVVSTRVGVEGIAARDGESILIADEPEDMAHALAGLIGSPAKARAIAKSARDLAKSCYDWSFTTRSLRDDYNGMRAS